MEIDENTENMSTLSERELENMQYLLDNEIITNHERSNTKINTGLIILNDTSHPSYQTYLNYKHQREQLNNIKTNLPELQQIALKDASERDINQYNNIREWIM